MNTTNKGIEREKIGFPAIKGVQPNAFSLSREFLESKSYDELYLTEGLEIFSDPRLDVIMPIIGKHVLNTHGTEVAQLKIEKFIDKVTPTVNFVSTHAEPAHRFENLVVLIPDEYTAKLLAKEREAAQDIFDIDNYIFPSRPPIIHNSGTAKRAQATIEAVNIQIQEIGGVVSLPFSYPRFKSLLPR